MAQAATPPILLRTLKSRVRGLDDVRLYKMTRLVANTVFRCMEEHNNSTDDGRSAWLEDQRGAEWEPDPLHDQTATGIFLEFRRRGWAYVPCCLWTLWGRWSFCGSGGGDWELITPALLTRLDADKCVEEWRISSGTRGPVYMLRTVSDIELPQPALLAEAAFFRDASYEDIVTHWELHREAHPEL